MKDKIEEMSQNIEQNDKVIKLKREKNLRKLNDRSMRFKIPGYRNFKKRKYRKVERGNPSNYMPINFVKLYLNKENQNRTMLRHTVKLQNARDKENILQASTERG